jgi:hypothetical protein
VATNSDFSRESAIARSRALARLASSRFRSVMSSTWAIAYSGAPSASRTIETVSRTHTV